MPWPSYELQIRELAVSEMKKLQSSYTQSHYKNCLPISMLSIPYLKSGISDYPGVTFPNAKVIIGGYVDDEESQLSDNYITKIKAYSKDKMAKRDIPEFHAWIDLGNGDILDFVIMNFHAKSNHEDFMNYEKSQQYKIYYRQVLTDAKDVSEFFENHKSEMHRL